MNTAIPDLPGWCSENKSSYLTEWVREFQPALLVEIGIFGGKSLIPVALEAQKYGGKVVGIDPWFIDDCLEGMVREENVIWWKNNSDLGRVKHQYYAAIKQLDLENTVKTLEMTSLAALDTHQFLDNSVDFLSIDGNHGPPAVQDGISWLPKLTKGALIACDDTDWEEGGIFYVRKMIDYLRDHGCTFLSIVDGCTMLQKD